jgi:hypothetical protein
MFIFNGFVVVVVVALLFVYYFVYDAVYFVSFLGVFFSSSTNRHIFVLPGASVSGGKSVFEFVQHKFKATEHVCKTDRQS